MRDHEITELIDMWAKKKSMRIPMTNLVSVVLDFTNFKFPEPEDILDSLELVQRTLLNEYFFTHIMSYWSYPSGFGDPYRVPEVYVVGLKESKHQAIMHEKWCFLSMEDLLNESKRLPGTQIVEVKLVQSLWFL